MKNSSEHRDRRKSLITVLLMTIAAPAWASDYPITRYGAKGDGKTINTDAIQSAIDAAAAAGGGTVVVPRGKFVSGALFLKPGVNLHLDKDAVLRCSTDMKNFPEQRTRIEGHFEEHFNPALINANGCDGLLIDGDGTLDGDGKPIWDTFWKLRNASKDKKNFRNLSVPRARLCLIENSKNVTVQGLTFKDSQFWNLHVYNCQTVLIEKVSFETPDGEKPPSSDGIDLDSCQDIVIRECTFSVNDDCIAAKGTKGPFAVEDKTSPPVENIRISGCEFRRGHSMFTCGSEATIVRNVVVEDCVVEGAMPLLTLKLRPDTPQCYEEITIRKIKVDSSGATIFSIQSWTQYFDLKGQSEPTSHVRNITVSDVEGSINYLGVIKGNKKTEFGSITLKDVDVKAKSSKFDIGSQVKNLKLDDVEVDGKEVTK